LFKFFILILNKFFFLLFISKENDNFGENSKLGYDNCPLFTILMTESPIRGFR
jgi:hypothetical protein